MEDFSARTYGTSGLDNRPLFGETSAKVSGPWLGGAALRALGEFGKVLGCRPPGRSEASGAPGSRAQQPSRSLEGPAARRGCFEDGPGSGGLRHQRVGTPGLAGVTPRSELPGRASS